MLKDGRYSVWFKTPVGEGAGVVELEPTGQLHGGDGVASYTGTWEQDGERLKATISSKRTTPGYPGVFGIDEIDITLTGRSNPDGTVSCKGFAKQAPGLTLEAMLIPIADG